MFSLIFSLVLVTFALFWGREFIGSGGRCVNAKPSTNSISSSEAPMEHKMHSQKRGPKEEKTASLDGAIGTNKNGRLKM